MDSTVVLAAASLTRWVPLRVERVVSTRVSLKCAGWVTRMMGPSKRNSPADSSVERNQLCDNVIAHSSIAAISRC